MDNNLPNNETNNSTVEIKVLLSDIWRGVIKFGWIAVALAVLLGGLQFSVSSQSIHVLPGNHWNLLLNRIHIILGVFALIKIILLLPEKCKNLCKIPADFYISHNQPGAFFHSGARVGKKWMENRNFT